MTSDFEKDFPSLKDNIWLYDGRNLLSISSQTKIAIKKNKPMKPSAVALFKLESIQENCIDKQKIKELIDKRLNEITEYKKGLSAYARAKHHAVISELKNLRRELIS